MKGSEWLENNASVACKKWLEDGVAIEACDCKWVTVSELTIKYQRLWWMIQEFNNGETQSAFNKICGYVSAMRDMEDNRFDALVEYIQNCKWLNQECSLAEYDEVVYSYGHASYDIYK